MVSKEYFLKVYDKTGQTLLANIRDFTFGSFIRRIGGGLGELKVNIPTEIQNIDGNIVFSLNNRCDVWVKDKDAPNGKRIYSGYIEGTNWEAKGKTQSFQLELVSHFTKLAQYPIHMPVIDYTGSVLTYRETGGVARMITNDPRGLLAHTTEPASSQPISKVMKSVLDYYLAIAVNPQVSYYTKQELYESYLFTDAAYKQYLKGYWRMEGNGNDDSGNSHPLTLIGKSPGGAYTADFTDPEEFTYKPTGYIGQALYKELSDFWAGASVVNHADLRPTGQFTVSAAIKTNGLNTDDTIIFSSANFSGTYKGFSFHLTSGGLVRIYVDGSTILTTTLAVDDGKWHQVVLSRTATHYKIYVDGKLAAGVASSTNPSYHATNYVRIGSELVDSVGFEDNAFNGFLDEVFIYNGYAFNDEDVRTLWGSDAITPTGNSLTYTFNSQTAKQILDLLVGYLPSTWFYFVNADNKFILDEKKHDFSSPFIEYKKGLITQDRYWNFDSNKIKDVAGAIYAYPYALDVAQPVSTNRVMTISSGSNDGEGRFKEGFAGNGSSRFGEWTETNDIYDVGRMNASKSMGCWFKLNSVVRSASNSLFQFYHVSAGDSYGFRVYIDKQTGKITYTVGQGSGGGSTDTTIGDALEAGKWYYLVITEEIESFSGQTGRFKVYLNGQLIGNTVHAIGPGNTPTYKRLGCINSAGSNSDFIDGNIDDFFIYATTLSQEEIWDLYYDKTAKHNLAYGDAVSSIQFKRSMKEMVNNFLFAGDPDSSIFNNYYDNDSEMEKRSIKIYDDWWKIEADGRVSTSTTARTKGESAVISGRLPKQFIVVEIIDNAYNPNGYDIESLEVGDTVKITNLEKIGKTIVKDEVFMIVGITYSKTTASLELATIDQLLAAEVSRVKNKQAEESNADNIATFTHVAIGN